MCRYPKLHLSSGCGAASLLKTLMGTNLCLTLMGHRCSLSWPSSDCSRRTVGTEHGSIPSGRSTGPLGEEGVVRLFRDRLQLLKAIHQRAGSASVCFDVFCWKDDFIIFAESKHKHKDEIRQTQLAWLDAAMQTGPDASAFLIVEWTSSGSPADIRARRRTSAHRRIAPLGARGVEGPKTDNGPPASTSPSREVYLVFYDAYDPDAHGKFLTWRERHLSGYVISRRSPSDAMIHQADCGHFEFGDESVSLTRTMKVCSASRRELDRWARENMGTPLRTCRSCI
jgi:hypothetical protein